MKKILTSIFLILALPLIASATHNRAAQIVFKHISGYTYEFTITTFTYNLAPADRQVLTVKWGDNTESEVNRDIDRIEYLPDDYKKNIYITQHTFPGPGIYTVMFDDPNRNMGVLNIPNSVGVVFSVKTVIRIDPNTGVNNSPNLLNYPIDRAALNRKFVHNPAAFDIDGDSLSYELTTCTREGGIAIEDYSFPEASNSLSVDATSGDLIWDAPTRLGLFNIAILIKEFRHGTQIGAITRDMQVEVVDSKNNPPEFLPIKDTCVVAQSELHLPISVIDAERDLITLTSSGGPFLLPSNPASFAVVDAQPGISKALFSWRIDYARVRKQPYQIVLKAEDQNPEVKLVSFQNFNITVIAPAVKNLVANPARDAINLSWDASPCPHATGFQIYRAVAPVDFELSSCQTGVPEDAGYELIAQINSAKTLSFVDDNNKRGLSPGIEYCYRVVTTFADGALSKPSEKACASILPGAPPFILADVEEISTNASVKIAWLRTPIQKLIDENPGPFLYKLFHTTDTAKADSWQLIYQTPTPNTDLKDTVFVHSPINTLSIFPHFYKVELYQENSATPLDKYEIASTLFPIIAPSDMSAKLTFGRYVPWLNAEYKIFRCLATSENQVCIPTEEIGTTNKETFTDSGLINGQTYFYRLESTGYRSIDGLIYNNSNRSHIASVTPVDNVPPCPPELSAKSICSEELSLLEWTTDPTCADDVQKYWIYYSPNGDMAKFEKVDSVLAPEIFSYKHQNSLRGCYYITAIDEAQNESLPSNMVCLDDCGEYSLPNVFSPNGDNINDLYKSYNPANVSFVDMKIYNRHGKLVFQTNDPAINWDGRDKTSKRFCSTGVYYYICDVHEERLTGSRIIPLTGFIHLYLGKNAVPYSPTE